MASPDITPYSDLTVFDKQPDEIYDDQVAYGRIVLPEWTPVAGSVEDALLQAASGVTGELLAAINRVPSSILEALLKLFGIERSTGSPPVAQIHVDFIDDQNRKVPAGTRFGWLDTSTTNPQLYVFETQEEFTASQQDSMVVVEAVGTLREKYPELDEGTPIRLLSNVSYVVRAFLEEDLDSGQDPETDQNYFTRAIAILKSYSAALVLPHQFETYVISEYTNVFRAKAFTRLDPTNPDNEIISENFSGTNGHLTVYACGVNGASLSSQSASAVVEDINSKSVGGLIVHVEPPHLVPIGVYVVLVVNPGFNGSNVLGAVEGRISSFLSPNSWDWGDVIFYNDIVAIIEGVPGVDRVDELVIYSEDDGATTLPGSLNLGFTRYGSLPIATVSVTGRV
jgi:hypothetical protein